MTILSHERHQPLVIRDLIRIPNNEQPIPQKIAKIGIDDIQRIKFMPQFFLTWLVAAVSLVITAQVVPGFDVDTFTAAAIAAIIMGLINAIVRPILVLMTLPLTILTLGLFLLVVNAISIGLVAYLTPGFTVTGFFPAVVGSLVLSFVSSLLSKFVGTDNQEA